MPKTEVDHREAKQLLEEIVKSGPLCPNCGDRGCDYCEGGHRVISQDDLVTVLLGGANSHKFVSLISETEPPVKSPKRSGMGGRIKKLSHMTIYMGGGVNYGTIVKGRQEKLAKEFGVEVPEWEPAPRQWGERVVQTPFVQHKGKLYLECLIVKCHKVEYKLDGNFVEFEDIEEFLAEKSTSSRQLLPDEKIAIWRTFGLDSIVQITIDGIVYSVKR